MSTLQPSTEFLTRQKRLEDAFNLRKPDRVPVAPVTLHYYSTRAKGISNKDAMYQWERRLQSLKESTIEHNWDAAPPVGAVGAAKPWELLGIQQVKWPGGALSDNLPFQWVEKEYMLQSEYDEMLADPNRFTINKLWPRIATTLEPLSRLAGIGNSIPLLPLSDPYTLPGFLGGMISRLGLQDFLEKMLNLSREAEKNNQLAANYGRGMMQLGYPVIVGAHIFCAFDWVSDSLRGLRGTSMDMYQVPDKLLAAIEMLIPSTIFSAVTMSQLSGIKSTVIYLHRGSAGFMSDAQFARFYWPSLKALIMGLINAGVRPIVYTEGNYTPRLKYFQELPPKKFVMHYQEVDRRLARKLLGNITCFWGNVPSALMCTGTPKQVEGDVKELIEIFADNGGLIIDSSVGIPDEARPENVQALTDAACKFGK
jgi:uroporphyrinogen-III decarboxylase